MEPTADVLVNPGQPGQLWVGTLGIGALVFHEGRLDHLFPSEAVSNVVRVLYRDRQGVQWLGSEFGLFSWDGSTLRPCKEAGLGHAYALAISEDAAGHLLVGTETGDLRRRSVERWETFLPDDGLPPSRFWTLLGDSDGGIWIGTLGGGLLYFEGGKFFRFTTQQGLPNNTVSQVLDDGRGQLWLGTRAGIVRVAKVELRAIASGHQTRANCVTYGRDDGLPTIECSGARNRTRGARRTGGYGLPPPTG
ncbi:MAG: two-component regulator propeller domain-containing protein [Limisphaerales bacterium]